MSSKPMPSLDGLIQAKGASRPETLQQRPAAVQPATQPAPAPAVVPVAMTAPEPKSKALTLRLSESQYQRLRRFAFDRGLSHQDVIERALMVYLDAAVKD
ncbi:hypothetical protein [Methylobacterium nigriterrae]|uniref:hypothetical protein n=1 Tax=Methylobacterium nigriterrae TaxID=3127512 RepID=UPI003013A7BD